MAWLWSKANDGLVRWIEPRAGTRRPRPRPRCCAFCVASTTPARGSCAGILTNGTRWRLYWAGARSISEEFLEIDLGRVQCRDDIRYIYSTFPVVEREETARWGAYRSRDLALAWINALMAGEPDAVIAG